MKDFLEVIAQQIDKVAANPLEAVMFIAGPLIAYQLVGWWGVLVLLVFMLAVVLGVDLVVYFLSDHQTFAKYRDSKLWVSGFHPIRARVEVRRFDRLVKEYGQEVVIEEYRKMGATVTRKEAS